eukprot:454987-Amorphochlora_amoeboformis.AAC.1
MVHFEVVVRAGVLVVILEQGVVSGVAGSAATPADKHWECRGRVMERGDMVDIDRRPRHGNDEYLEPASFGLGCDPVRSALPYDRTPPHGVVHGRARFRTGQDCKGHYCRGGPGKAPEPCLGRR